VLICATVAAAWWIADALLGDRDPPESVPTPLVVLGLAVSGATLLVGAVLLVRASRMGRAYRAEYTRRRPRFRPERPRWWRRLRRAIRLTALPRAG
jgi:hypothetical protein